MVDTEKVYRRVLRSGVVTKTVFAELYRMPEEDVMFFAPDAARAIKVAIQGDRDDGDMYGGQQRAPSVLQEMPD